VTNLDNEQEFLDLELSNMKRTIAKRLPQSNVGFLKFHGKLKKLNFMYIISSFYLVSLLISHIVFNCDYDDK